MILQELSLFCGSKAISGVGQLNYAPIVDLEQPYVPTLDVNGGILFGPTFITGNRWLVLPFVAAAEKLVSDGVGDNKFGVTHKQSITVTLPNMSSKAVYELNKMKIVRDFVVKYQDKNGSWWLLGDTEFPCFFDYDKESSGRIKVTWTANNIRPILML